MRHSDVDALCEALFNARIHVHHEEGIEFALAVHIHAHPNYILSVWVRRPRHTHTHTPPGQGLR